MRDFTRHDLTRKQLASLQEALITLGTLGGKVNSERNFRDDHDLKSVMMGKSHPRRIAHEPVR